MSIQTNKLPDNPQIEVIKSGKTGLFTNYIYKAIPLAFDESMSYYETLCGLLNYLKNVVIPTVNNNADAVAELQTLYEELRKYVDDYFKGLDVQDEINNKLDEMVKDGTLPEIISSYLNSKAIFGFDNVELMKNSINLIDGSYAETLGYYTKNDGGNALYKIRNITNEDVVDNMFIIALNDENLIAELIIDNNINVKKLGAYGDNVHDDYLVINNAITKATNGSTIYFPKGTYLISQGIIIDRKDLSIIGESGSTIKASASINNLFFYRYDNTMQHNRVLRGLCFDGDGITNNVLVLESMALRVEDILVLNPIEKGVYITHKDLEYGVISETFINNLTVINRKEIDNYQGVGIYVDTSDSSLINIVTVNMKIGVYAKDGENYFYNIHPWVANQNVFPNSYGIYNTGYGNIFTNCYLDTVFYGLYSNVDTTLNGGSFKIGNSYYELISSNPIFLYGEPRGEGFPYPTITAIGCYFENETNKTYNPYISNTQNTVLITPKRHPSASLFHIVDNLNDYIPFRKEKFYRVNIGTISVGAKSSQDKDITIQGLRYDDVFTWTTLGGYLPDGIIANVYLKNNAITVRYYNTTDSQIDFAIPLLLTIKTNLDNTVIQKTIVS